MRACELGRSARPCCHHAACWLHPLSRTSAARAAEAMGHCTALCRDDGSTVDLTDRYSPSPSLFVIPARRVQPPPFPMRLARSTCAAAAATAVLLLIAITHTHARTHQHHRDNLACGFNGSVAMRAFVRACAAEGIRSSNRRHVLLWRAQLVSRQLIRLSAVAAASIHLPPALFAASSPRILLAAVWTSLLCLVPSFRHPTGPR